MCYACETWPLALREASKLRRLRAKRRCCVTEKNKRKVYRTNVNVCYMHLYLKRSEQSYPIKDMDRPLGLQDIEGPRISRQSAHERHMKVVRLSALRTAHLYSQQTPLIVIIFRGWGDTGAIVRPERLGQWKIPMSSSAVEPNTFRLLAQCYNNQRHRVHQK